MDEPTLIALDAGTTGITAILFDSELRPLHRAYREFPQSFPAPGRVEHDCRQILDAVDACLESVLEQPQSQSAVGIGITNQRETVFPMDPGIDEALRPGIVWQDRRTAERCKELRQAGKEDWIRKRTGLVLDPYFSATKIEWMLANHGDLRERAEGDGVIFSTVDAMVVQHLTEQEHFATDPTNASRTMLFDIEAKAWDPELCELFGLSVDWLPEVRPSVGDFGITSKYLLNREIPIRGVAGDQQAALFGQGCTTAGSLKCTFGTGCFLLLNTAEQRVESEKGLLTTLAVARGGGASFALEGSVFVAGAAIQWLRDELKFFENAAESEALARSVPDSAGVIMVPAFTGLGAPHWDPDARGAILGLTRGANRAHVTRAALESIAFQNAALIEILRSESKQSIDSVLVDGGAAANDFLMQMQADLAQVRVVRPSQVEATARGAAALAGVSAGLFDDPTQCAFFAEGRTEFEPAISAEAAAAKLEDWERAVSRVLSRES